MLELGRAIPHEFFPHPGKRRLRPDRRIPASSSHSVGGLGHAPGPRMRPPARTRSHGIPSVRCHPILFPVSMPSFIWRENPSSDAGPRPRSGESSRAALKARETWRRHWPKQPSAHEYLSRLLQWATTETAGTRFFAKRVLPETALPPKSAGSGKAQLSPQPRQAFAPPRCASES